MSAVWLRVDVAWPFQSGWLVNAKARDKEGEKVSRLK